jgi:hypothetical protein
MKALELNVMEMNELEIKGALLGLIKKIRSKKKLLRIYYDINEIDAEDELLVKNDKPPHD